MIYALVDKDHHATTRSGSVRPVANVVREPYDPLRHEVGLVEEAYINAVLTEELFHFQLPVSNTINVPAGQPQVFTRCSHSPRRHAQPRKE
jgi:hypothetical protein